MADKTTAEVLASAYLRRLARGDSTHVQKAAEDPDSGSATMPDGLPLPRREIARACLHYAYGFSTPEPGTDAWRAWFLVDTVFRS